MASLKVKFKAANALVVGPPGLRADLVASMPGDTKQIIADVRTADPRKPEISVVLRVRVHRYYRVLLPLWVGTFEFQWT